MIDRAALLALARSQVAVPWVHQKAAWNVAHDCVGLIAACAARAGSEEGARFLANPLNRQYGPNPLPDKLLTACREFMDEIPVHDALPGDVYMMRFFEEPQHFGFLSCVDPPRLIHTWATIGKVCEHAIDFKWRRRIIGAWRLRGIGPWPA